MQTGDGVIEHDFQNGLTVKNGDASPPTTRSSTRTSIRATGRSRARSTRRHRVQPRGLQQHDQSRQRSSTRPTSPTRAAPGRCFTRVAFGTEFGRQTGMSTSATPASSRTGPTRSSANPFAPTYFGPVNFIHHFTGTNTDGVTTPDSNSKYRAQHRVRLPARHDRNHALAPADRRRALRPLRDVGAGHEHRHQRATASTIWCRRRRP